MANYCTECGRELNADWNVCPDCGTHAFKDFTSKMKAESTIPPTWGYQPSVAIKQKKVPSETIKEFIWIVYLIAGLIGGLAILAPSGVYQLGYFGIVIESWNMWMYGYNVLYDYMHGSLPFWTDMPVPLLLSVITTLIIAITTISIVISALRLRNREVKTSKNMLGRGIVLIVTAIAYIVVFHIYTLLMSGSSIWSLMGPGFGLIGQFISGVLIIIGHIIVTKTP